MNKKIKSIIILILILTSFCLISFLYYQYQVNTVLSDQDKKIKFIIKKGENLNQIAENLQKKEIIKSAKIFKIYLWENNLQTKIKAGNYSLNNNINIKKIVEILIKGKVVLEEQTIKILEGWNIKDINNYLQENNIFTNNEFLNFIENKDLKLDYDFLEAEKSLEGYLFPDTYRIYKNSTPEMIVKKMLTNFEKKLNPQMKYDIAQQNKSIYEILTMASIVQKEVQTEKDMKMVAGIFWQRINNGQALQSCATLAYILGENKKQYSYKDTQIISPYNTYKNKNLPPGPISNPGLEAIKASIYPEKNDYNYFLNAFETGETIFSKTYQEHLNNKNKYLK